MSYNNHDLKQKRIVAYVALAVLFLLLVPLLRLTEYSVPWYDDLNYGLWGKNAIDSGLGIIGALKAATDCVKTQWYAWQGTYSSVFFMAMMPGIFGEEYYFLGPVFLILMLTCSSFFLMYTILKSVFGADRYDAMTVATVTSAMCIVLIHSSQAGLYWYNGGIHYVGMHSFFMIWAALSIRMLNSESKIKTGLYFTLYTMLSLIVAGSNYITALQGLVVALCFAGASVFIAKNRCYLYVLAVSVYIYCFKMNVTAPGNSHRAASYEGWGYSPVEAVLRSFLEAFKHIPKFTGWITVAVMVVLLPTIINVCLKNKFKFKFPFLVMAFSFCIYATGFTPSLYSLGHAGIGRSLNAVKLTYQILLIFNEVYCVGWLVHKYGMEPNRFKIIGRVVNRVKMGNRIFYPWGIYLGSALLMVLIFAVSPNQAGCYSSYGAYYYVHTGEAYNFHDEYMKRVEVLRSDEKDVVFKEFTYKPWMICMGDLDENPDAEENLAVEAWYGKDTVRVIKQYNKRS